MGDLCRGRVAQYITATAADWLDWTASGSHSTSTVIFMCG
jgi:hypothetical protein